MSAALEKLATLTPVGYRDVPPQAIAVAGADVRVIDVREPNEWSGELGHIIRAELVPLATLPAQAATWNRDATYIMVCRSGARSGRAATAMLGMGFTDVYNMAGGMLAYGAAGLPTER